MTVSELIAELSKYHPDAEVLGTWESVVRDIDVYQAKTGEVLIDADNNHYKDGFVSGGISVRDRY